MFIRVYLLWRCYFNYSSYTDAFARKLCDEYGFTAGVRFTFKCVFEMHPTSTIAWMFVL